MKTVPIITGTDIMGGKPCIGLACAQVADHGPPVDWFPVSDEVFAAVKRMLAHADGAPVAEEPRVEVVEPPPVTGFVDKDGKPLKAEPLPIPRNVTVVAEE